MGMFRGIFYCAGFALVCAWAVVWILERKEKKYGQEAASFTDAFPAGAAVLVFVFLSALSLLFKNLRAAALYGLALTAALLLFIWRKEAGYRARAKNKIKNPTP